ncbi:hypothetical protein F442_12636 [Phytophthora nicotianae P10297]|uniref:Elicitin n=2 Tax=Phytophthora nicotianae TaxID=4792 RepID=V9ES60_PHYNI|nr:hypothetical protein F443_12731 [Phytophthora nicotianae P1569]ETP39993.1 hypothetical protein F442_12636 [Phytophthora nicotianae P10297]
MQVFATFVVAMLFMSAPTVQAGNCTTQAINDVLQPMTSDPNYIACQSDSNYTLQSLAGPSLKQIRAFCSSSACQTLLNNMQASGILPDCNVATGNHPLSLTDAVVLVSSKCVPSPAPLKLQERVVDNSDVDSKAKRISGHISSALSHSAPMDDVGGVAGALLSLLRR